MAGGDLRLAESSVIMGGVTPVSVRSADAFEIASVAPPRIHYNKAGGKNCHDIDHESVFTTRSLVHLTL